MYRYGLIGNCQASALVSESGAIDWLCFPRPDSPPVFGRLLDAQGGTFSVELQNQTHAEQHYLENTNVLITTLRSQEGYEVRITDFCPRFMQHNRMYRPNAVFRMVEAAQGSPAVIVRCAPIAGWARTPVSPIRGNNHLRFDMGGDALRLLTNMPLTYLVEPTPFIVHEPIYFALSWGFGIEEDLQLTTQTFLKNTVDYWRTWVKHCSIPSHYQAETIRSALALKLHCYEDTGAILAALTTSLPEEHGNERNWDYRYCWLRDAAFSLSAFHNLGHFEEMEGFIHYLLNLLEKDAQVDRLRPVYRLDQTLPLPEETHSAWAGFAASQPVRSGNQAAEHVQNDVYGEMVLTLGPIFFDDRFKHLRTPEIERMMRKLAQLCERNISSPDAGLWEIRNGWQEHSFSNLMCWAGLERLERIQARGYLDGLDFATSRKRAEEAVRKATREGSLRNGPTDDSLDASLLMLPLLRFPDASLCRETVLKIYQDLNFPQGEQKSAYLFRYKRKDDFGRPQSAFLICSFWLVSALVRIGEIDAARRVMDQASQSANTLGLLSEHFLPEMRGQAGNFPQAYSHVGQINAAFALSPMWSEIL